MNNPYLQWFSDDELAKAHENYQRTQNDHDGSDHWPVIKLSTPSTQCVWLITEVDPASNDYALGLCDQGCGIPELGYLLLSELTAVRDEGFKATSDIMAYAKAARRQGRIVEPDNA